VTLRAPRLRIHEDRPKAVIRITVSGTVDQVDTLRWRGDNRLVTLVFIMPCLLPMPPSPSDAGSIREDQRRPPLQTSSKHRPTDLRNDADAASVNAGMAARADPRAFLIRKKGDREIAGPSLGLL
jgi:hypothetical protein